MRLGAENANQAPTNEDQQEMVSALEAESPGLPLRRSDLNTRAVSTLVKEKASRWVPVGPSAAKAPTSQGPLEKVSVIPGILGVPTLDEDGQKIPFAKKATFRALRALPPMDDATPWRSLDVASEVISAEFLPVLPPIGVQWANPTSDRAIELLAVQGLAAHRLKPVKDDPHGAAFCVDLSWMQGLPVRAGFEPYGAAAYFSAQGKLLRIYTAHDDKTHLPGSVDWEMAKWRWRTALFTVVTVTDHLGSTHFLASNIVTTTSQEKLPSDHPIRRLLKPHTYGAVDINYSAALMLAPEGGLAHRMFAFTYDGLARLLLRGTETPKFQTFPEAIAEQHTESLGERFLYGKDGLALYNIFHRYVREYVDIFYQGKNLQEDSAIRAWWQGLEALAPNLGLGPLNRPAQVIDLLTHYIFTVTGFHSHVGGVVDYLLDPRFMGAKIRPGTQMSDIQTTVQLLNLTALTSLQQPSLLGDYTHVFLEQHKEEAVAVFERYQEALRELSREIKERNLQIEQPYQTFNPELLDTSVST